MSNIHPCSNSESFQSLFTKVVHFQDTIKPINLCDGVTPLEYLKHDLFCQTERILWFTMTKRVTQRFSSSKAIFSL